MDLADELRAVHAAASAIADAAQDAYVAGRLRQSVIRPLAGLIGTPSEPAPNGSVADLAMRATRLRLEPGVPLELVEAVAAFQELAVGQADDGERLAAEFADVLSSLPVNIQTQHNGPYLLTNVGNLRDWLGQEIPVRPQLALCRCGASSLKPLCDGSHAETGFTDAKDPDRVPDRLDAYTGAATIFDNRGTCAHSGFCTSRVPTAFRVDQQPFVAPSGGRVDEIVRAARACPSGALSFAVDGQDVRELNREPAVEVSRDGPYRVRGGIDLIDADGAAVPRNAGASLEHYSLCRCGHSQNKPFCSGMHYYVGFADPTMPDEPTLFEWCGGYPVLLRTTSIFYEKYVPEDPLLAPLFAAMSPDHPERVASWLSETFGGPTFHTQRYGGYDRMVSQHLGKGLGEEQRARWVQLLVRSADEAGIPTDPEFRAAFVSYLEWGSRIAVENSTPGAKPPPHMPVPRWDWVVGAKPGARVSALRPETEDEPAIILPAPGDPVRYAEHVKPLFRRTDRESMSFAFDLWEYADVSQHADAILERLEAGSMPCDGAWPQEQIAAFRAWIAGGKPE